MSCDCREAAKEARLRVLNALAEHLAVEAQKHTDFAKQPGLMDMAWTISVARGLVLADVTTAVRAVLRDEEYQP